MLRHSNEDSLPIHTQQFDTPQGPVTARIVNTPENSSAEASDQRWFRLKFSDGQDLMIVLSDVALEHDSDGSYKRGVFNVIQDWLRLGGPPTIRYFG